MLLLPEYVLTSLLVKRVLVTKMAVFLKLDSSGVFRFILGSGVVSTFALRALKNDQFPHQTCPSSKYAVV